MNSNINKNQALYDEHHLEFFGGEMRPYVDDATKNYEQKLSTTKFMSIPSKPVRNFTKVSFWRKFAAFFSFL